MKKMEFGPWEIEVDMEKTKEYYANFSINEADTQCYRNFSKYCKSLLESERTFFEQLGINPLCCNVSTIGLTEDKRYPTYGYYVVAGKFIKKPKENLMLAEELIEKDFKGNWRDPRIYIGKFQFEPLDPDSVFGSIRIPQDKPEGFICFSFFSEQMPWLLKERCKNRMFQPPKSWQLLKRFRLYLSNIKSKRDNINKLKRELEGLLKQHHISYRLMNKPETKIYMKNWFINIVPTHNQEEAHGHCFSDGKYNNYLWHAFSFEDAPCAEDDCAKQEFNSCSRGKTVLIMNSQEIGYELESFNGITADDLDSFYDIIVTDENFEWAYVHTHEGNCGPYFYQKNKTFLKFNEEALEILWTDDKVAYCEILPFIRGDYYAKFHIQDHDNFGNLYYRGYYLEKRIKSESKEELIEQAKQILNQIVADDKAM